jgi:hypothetical protein
MNYEELFCEALSQQDRVMALREAVIKLRTLGIDKETLLAELEIFLAQTNGEDGYDVVLDVMDFLVGWCSPHMLSNDRISAVPSSQAGLSHLQMASRRNI